MLAEMKIADCLVLIGMSAEVDIIIVVRKFLFLALSVQ